MLKRLFAFLPLLAAVTAWDYKVQTPPLTTNWTYTVGTSPWPEYPRPQMTRDRWQNLNGVWSYRNASSYDEVYNPPTGDLGRGVLIPSCLESGLSGMSPVFLSVLNGIGIMAPVTANGSVLYSWFQTTFDVPNAWDDDQVLINFQAVDYETTVFVNVSGACIS